MATQIASKFMLAVIIVVCLLFQLSVKPVFSKGYGLSLSPTTILISPQKDGVFKKNVTVQNTGGDPISLIITPRIFHSDKEGKLIYVRSESLSDKEKRFITEDVDVLENDISVREIILAPNQKQSLTIKISINDIQNISEYTFSILFFALDEEISPGNLSDESPLNADLGIEIGSAIHVLISNPSKNELPAISSFTTNQFLQQGPVEFQVKAANENDKYINIYGNITIENVFRQRVGLVRIPNQIILSGTNVKLRSNEAPLELSWKEKLLLGPYKAKVTIFDDYGQTTTKTASFFAFPIKTVLLVLVGLLIASYLIGEIRKRVR